MSAEGTVSWDDLTAETYAGMSAEERAEFDAGVAEKSLALDVGDLVHEVRTRVGLTQAELAERVGTSQPAISAIERAVQLPTLPLLNRLANAMGTTLEVRVGPEPDARELKND